MGHFGLPDDVVGPRSSSMYIVEIIDNGIIMDNQIHYLHFDVDFLFVHPKSDQPND